MHQRSDDRVHRLPAMRWLARYDRRTFENDAIAAVIVTLMLVPQSMAYAILAGMPPQAGLYASMLPLVAYAVLGTSRSLAVGPVAVVCLMTAAALNDIAPPGSPAYVTASGVLAAMTGMILVGMGLLRLGFLTNLLSHPVMSGFTTAAGLLIAASQIKNLTGIPVKGETLPRIVVDVISNIGAIHPLTLGASVLSLTALLLARSHLKPFLKLRGLAPRAADILTRAAPAIVVAIAIAVAAAFRLSSHGLKVVGDIPRGLPALALPSLDPALWRALLAPALFIALIGFLESVSVAQSLAARRRERVEADNELTALGASNLAAAVSGAFPVAGGFSRSMVNDDAGAETPAAGAMTALGLALSTMLLTPLLHHLPYAVLATIILVAVAQLIDFKAVAHTWAYSRTDAAAMIATIAATLVFGVEPGIITGIGLSIGIHLYRASRPHYAVLGQVPGSEHFRNVERHRVVTSPSVLSIRPDESLLFVNARFLDDLVLSKAFARAGTKHVVLMCSAVNEIDSSALEALFTINDRLAASGISLHLSEVKGPITDRFKRIGFAKRLSGQIFLTHVDALRTLDPLTTIQALAAARETTSEIAAPLLTVRHAGESAAWDRLEHMTSRIRQRLALMLGR